MKRFIRLDEAGKVYSIRYGKHQVEDEMESALGELGECRRPDGSFYMPEQAEAADLPGFEDQVMERLSEVTRTLMLLKESLAK